MCNVVYVICCIADPEGIAKIVRDRTSGESSPFSLKKRLKKK